ncbi:hypothetical protein ACM9HF_09525 [Colwellia sp. RE-S-Sl-9]
MNKFIPLCLLTFAFSASAADWSEYPVPAKLDKGQTWQLDPLSDDFNYNAPAKGKSNEFFSRWKEGYIGAWSGPGKTVWEPLHSSVKDGKLVLIASRVPLDYPEKEKAGGVFAGSITSKKSVLYPIFMEARVKFSNTVLASDFWLLSQDSTQEIDIIEHYAGDGVDIDGDGVIDNDNSYFAKKLHISNHMFIRKPFTDYQPSDKNGVFGTYYWEESRKNWRDDYVRIGTYWKSPNHIEYFVNGKWVRTITNTGYSFVNPKGKVETYQTDFNPMDKFNYNHGKGLDKPMRVILNIEDQDWRNKRGLTPTDADLLDDSKNNYIIDWVRFYKPISQ